MQNIEGDKVYFNVPICLKDSSVSLNLLPKLLDSKAIQLQVLVNIYVQDMANWFPVGLIVTISEAVIAVVVSIKDPFKC